MIYFLFIYIKTVRYSKMNAHKKQTLQKQIIEQSNSQILDLNDFVLGYDGARIVGALLPEYHRNLKHIRLNGNNIDSQGFQLIFSGLLHCPHLKSIQAEWNSIGSSEAGLSSLCHLVNNLHQLQLIDLKNNRISHNLAHFIAAILQMNRKSLKVFDLRWNDLGELGARQIVAVLPFNKNIKFIGLEDNRISMGSLMQIESILKTGANPQKDRINQRSMKHSNSLPHNTFVGTGEHFPISTDEYASMDVQLKTGEIRAKINNQQKQAERYVEKVQVQIQKVLQKIKLKGAQNNQLQLRYQSLLAQNQKLTSELRESERILAYDKQKILGVQSQYNSQKSQMRNQKYRLNNNIQNVMQKFTHRNQRELQEIQLVMNQKLDRLNSFLKQRLHEKRTNRDRLTQLRQDIFKLKINKEDLTNKGIVNYYNNKNEEEENIFVIKQEIAKAKATMQNQIKKGEYMQKQLNSQVIKALHKEQNLQKSIFEVQNKIKNIHHQMALKNLDLQKNLAELKLKQSQIFDKESTIQMQTRYLKYIQSQSNVKIEVQSMVQQQLKRGNQISDQGIDSRTIQVQKALRAQQAQNRMIKNQYQKMMLHLQNVAKKSISLVLAP